MNYNSKNVKCPFYVDNSKTSIKCEGDATQQCIHLFPNAAEKKAHFELFCCGDHKTCKHARNIEKKYDSEVT